MNPRGFTARQLSVMDEARTRSQWNHTSHLLAWIQNSVATAGNLVTPQELNPYAEEEEAPTNSPGLTVTPQVLRAMVRAMNAKKGRA